jgi:group I intron endonuclease
LIPEYNLLKIAGSSLGYKHSEESLAKMSEAMTGKTLSAETKTLISEALSGENHPRGMKGKTYSHSEESKTKISVAKGTTIYVYDTNDTLVNSFSSASKAALHFNVSKTTILRYIANQKIFKENLILSVSERSSE